MVSSVATTAFLGLACGDPAARGGASSTDVAASARSAAPATSRADALVYEHEVGGNVDIYVVSLPGGTPRRLTDDPGVDCHARWMPDGRTIVYTASRAGKPQIWEVPAAGGTPRAIRSNDAGESQPDPSPDGRSLAFISDVEGQDRLMVMDLRTGDTSTLVRHQNRTIFGNPHWSPDGSRVVFSSNWPRGHQIYVADVASGKAHPLEPAALACEPRFRPDGKAVAFVLRGDQSPTSQLVEQDLATGERRVLVDWPALNYDLAYSPGGTEVAFSSNISGDWVVYRQRLSDGRAWRVTVGGRDARYPDYRPRAAGLRP